MSTMPSSTEAMWVVSERGDRWYRAVCRFAPAMTRPSSTLRIERVRPNDFKMIMTRVRSIREPVILIWELSDDDDSLAAQLDQIVTIRTELPNALQLAWLPSTTATITSLAAQEAGIGYLLAGPGSLPQVSRIVARHFSDK